MIEISIILIISLILNLGLLLAYIKLKYDKKDLNLKFFIELEQKMDFFWKNADEKTIKKYFEDIQNQMDKQ